MASIAFILPVVHTREQLLAGGPIDQSGDGETIAGLKGSHGRLRLRRKHPTDRARVEPEVAQMLLRHLNVTGGEAVMVIEGIMAIWHRWWWLEEAWYQLGSVRTSSDFVVPV
jgi:hypothetical protein